jgi:hypothetical protein
LISSSPLQFLSKGAGSSVATATASTEIISCTLRGLSEAIETIVFEKEKWPMVSFPTADLVCRLVVVNFVWVLVLVQIIDPSGQAARFLRFQRGSFLLADSPTEMSPGCLTLANTPTSRFSVFLGSFNTSCVCFGKTTCAWCWSTR